MNAKIIDTVPGQVRLSLSCHSACAHCEAHRNCGFAESKEKEIVVDCEQWQDYAKGDTVEVDISEKLGLSAVFIAYLLPSVLAIALFVCVYHRIGELWSALSTLAFFALYSLVLWAFRSRLQKHFTYTLHHSETTSVETK